MLSVVVPMLITMWLPEALLMAVFSGARSSPLVIALLAFIPAGALIFLLIR